MGRRYVSYGAEQLPRRAGNNLEEYMYSLMSWADTHRGPQKPHDPTQKVSLFVPIEDDLWFLGRGQYEGQSQDTFSSLSGVILKRNFLEHIGWVRTSYCRFFQ